MKKLNSKQKLIGGIAIILVAVIIAIVITTSIVNNNQVANEGYSATTANGDSELIANYIKKGITIGGVTGKLESLNTFDATAKPEDIALGKTAYVKGEKITGTRAEPISNEDLQISVDNVYYADLDSSGEISVDGVIFADLAGEEESGKWNGDSWSSYIIPSEAGLKQYYIKGEYTDEHFGTGKVIAPMEGTSGNERFYVMSLEDINPETRYCWYDEAYGKLDKTVATSENDFGRGIENTEYVNEKWNDPSLPWGAHNDNSSYDDMWEVIQEEIADGWFVPSKSEWSAFGAAFGITSSNYSNTYGLSYYYWSSSQNNAYYAYSACFDYGYINSTTVGGNNYVRLAPTF